MRPSLRTFLAILGLSLGLLAPAVALTPGQEAVLFGGGGPLVYTDFTAINSTLPPRLYTYSGPSLRMITDATGAITYAPNNLLTYSNTFSNSAWTKDGVTLSNVNAIADPFGGTQATTMTAASGNLRIYQGPAISGPNALFSIWVKRRTGTGTVNIRNQNGSTTDVTSAIAAAAGNWVNVKNTPNPGTSTNIWVAFGTSGDALDIYGAVEAAVTSETTPRPGDQVITTSAVYYGPAFDINAPSAGVPASGLRDEAAAKNLYLNSGVPATQTITVANATQYTGSILGTGTQAFTGAFTATLTGAANTLTQATLTSATTSLVATDTGLTSTAYPQVEAGSFATSRIITGASSLTRAADTIGVTGLLAALATTNPIIVERQSIATGAISRTLYAKNTFAFANGYWYRKLAAYPANTPAAILNAIAASQRPMK